MAQPNSDDLRCKLLEAYEAEAGTLQELAGQFRVSWGYCKKIRVQEYVRVRRSDQRSRMLVRSAG